MRFVVITPKPVTVASVRDAWTYAIRHTAKELDVADHEAAIKLMIERILDGWSLNQFARP